ncbi:MAG: DUF3108 domain-containing protein [Halobacteriovoraceae bacterium]|nr:DUF3108 domain-containing protein [Halobacteriovoraceae bacterium]
MKNQNLYAQTLMLAILLFGCATNKDTDFLDLDSQGVEETLNVDQKFLTKFKVEATKDKRKSPRLIESPEEITKGKPKKDEPKKLAKKTKTTEEKIEKNSSTEEGKNKGEFSYPKDYPEAFIKYDKTSIKAWRKFQPKILVGERFTFKVTYLGVTAGHIQMETLPEAEISGQSVFHFKARMRSARYYSYFYTLDDSLESFVSKDDFIPMKYVLLQRESAQKVDDLQLFDSDELLTYHFYKRLKRGKRKELELKKPIPRYFQDSYSALYFVRGFPLKKGDRYEFPIVTRGKIWILKILVEGTEVIDVNGENVKAIRLNAETRFPGVLEKKGDILFWYSADKLKKLLKFEAQVKIGSVEGELVDYTSGKSHQTL